jgi:cytokinesis protein
MHFDATLPLVSILTRYLQTSHQKNMELEDDERRREKRAQMAATAQARQAARDPLNSANTQSTGAMDALLDKLRAAGPSSRDKREARRRARLRQNGAVRAASITKTPEIDGEQKSDDPAAGDGEQPASPDITVTSAEKFDRQNEEEDSLTNRTQEMLMRLRGDSETPSTSAAMGKGSLRDKRKERRRRNGSNVSVSSTASGSGSLASLMSSPPVPPLPTGAGGLGITGAAVLDGDDAGARAKNALMAMRRGSDTGSETPGQGRTPVVVVENGDGDGSAGTPATIISPPSPEPVRGEDINSPPAP